ncbi:hypothetical protein VSU19_05540 [Verrucomicrobiales bacterium BCK34]|nr:hypothetical protein [Verrucomicrobiales bacterium BCK34]
MPKHTNRPKGQKTRRLLNSFVRWTFRFLGWTAVATLVSVIIAALIAVIAYNNRVQIVNRALATLIEPFDVSLETISLRKLGEITIEDLKLTPKQSDSPNRMAEIGNLKITYDIAELRATQRLKTIQLDGVALTLDQSHLDALTSPPAIDTPEAEAARFDLSSLAQFTDSIEVNKSHLSLDLEALPPVKADWSFKTQALKFDESGMTKEPLSLELSNIRIGSKSHPSDIKSVSMKGEISRDLNRFVIDSLIIDHPSLNIRPEWILNDNQKTAEAPEEAGPAKAEAGDSIEVEITDFQLIEGSFAISGFDGTNATPAFPDVSFINNFQIGGLRYSHGRFSNEGAFEISLRDLSAGETGNQLLSVDELKVKVASLSTLMHDQEVQAIELDGVSVVLSDESMSRFQQEGEDSPASGEPVAERAESEEKVSKPWRVKSARIDDGTFLMSNFHSGESPLPRIESRVTAELSDLSFGDGGFSSEAQQMLTLENTSIRAPGATSEEDPIFQLNLAELEGSWAEFRKSNLITSLTVKGPSINFTDKTLGDWLTPAEGGAGTETAGPVNRPVYKVKNLDITGGQIVADSQFAKGAVPKLYGKFKIFTNPEDEEDFLYHLIFNDVKLSNHPHYYEMVGPPRPATLFPDRPQTETYLPVAEEEVFTVRQIELDATAEELQRTRRIGRIKLSGGVLKVGNGLKELGGGGSKKEEEEAPEPDPEENPKPEENKEASAAKLPTWTIGEIEVTRSKVQFEALVPQIEGLSFSLETRLENVPLSLDGLLAEDTLQKVELSGIEIKDPYNSFITVATLPTIFVEFSLAGLASQEVEKIDLVGPSLHVGQGLFWWIDYQRNFREQNEGASVGFEAEGPVTKSPDWKIKEINATAGKIVIAPTGVPIALVPFPFNATTKMSDGAIELKLTIPDEDYIYHFPDYKVDLHGLEGKVQFNVPVVDENNNLVQTFSLDRAIFRKYEAENLYLTVTFDSNGVYGKFGGDAYSGYAEGEFNFYLNDPGKWDAWVAGTALDTGPLTDVIVPENFKMDGLATVKIVSEGRGKVPGETTGEITLETPGWFHITKLDQILAGLPTEWTPLQRSLTTLGLDALKRFDYEQGAGSLSLHEQEGDLQLRFAGPYGTRELNLFLHDERNITLETNGGVDDQPRASARAVE